MGLRPTHGDERTFSKDRLILNGIWADFRRSEMAMLQQLPMGNSESHGYYTAISHRNTTFVDVKRR